MGKRSSDCEFFLMLQFQNTDFAICFFSLFLTPTHFTDQPVKLQVFLISKRGCYVITGVYTELVCRFLFHSFFPNGQIFQLKISAATTEPDARVCSKFRKFCFTHLASICPVGVRFDYYITSPASCSRCHSMLHSFLLVDRHKAWHQSHFRMIRQKL